MGITARFIQGQKAVSEIEDGVYWQQLAYIFELRVPGMPRVYRTLLLGPTAYSFQRNFAQAVDLGQRGSVHVHEYGISTGEISLTIDPGFKPRKLQHDARSPVLAELSGHGRFKQIRDEIISAYSWAKRNPRTNRETKLILHVLKDGESWEVVPKAHLLQRASERPFHYPYSIEMTVVAAADAFTPTQPQDARSLLDRFRDPARRARVALQKAQATLDDINELNGEAKLAGQTWFGVVDDAARLFESVGYLVDGTKPLIDFPRASVVKLIEGLERSEESLDETRAGVEEFALRYQMSELTDLVYEVASYRTLFGIDLDLPVNRKRHRQRGVAGYSTSELTRASGTTKGSGATATDAVRAQAGADEALDSVSYAGFVEHRVLATDTPSSIEARYGTVWPDVVEANRLRAPYFSPASLPGTVAPGGKIVVPVATGIDQDVFATVGSGNATIGASQQEDAYGYDILSDPTEGYAIDKEHGSTDFRLVGGNALMLQAVERRVQTPVGENLVWPADGLPFQPGSTNALENQVLGRLSIRQCLRRDPRVDSVGQMTVLVDGDQLQLLDIQVKLRDSSQLRKRGTILT